DGKMAIHPNQIQPINETFYPSEEEIEWAKKVIRANNDADTSGVFTVDGEMIDAPLIQRAKRILEQTSINTPSSSKYSLI
ncbi:MAG: hypothetical protein ABEI86_05250, partial [Halobacteriaceae archaeon]